MKALIRGSSNRIRRIADKVNKERVDCKRPSLSEKGENGGGSENLSTESYE